MRLQRIFVASFLFYALIFVSFVAASDGGVYDARNVVLENGVAQLGRSGKSLFFDSFETKNAWPTIENYRNLLDVEFGFEHNGVKALYVGRTKPIQADDDFPKDTAWSISTDKIELPQNVGGKEFVARCESYASKLIQASGETDGYRGRVVWYDERGEELVANNFYFSSDLNLSQTNLFGIIPEKATLFSIRIGFDTPNIEIGEYVVVRSVGLEVIDSEKRYLEQGSFVSGIFQGGDVSWKATTPNGSRVEFQAAELDTLSQSALETLFVGPDGTEKTRYTEPFTVTSPWTRYKVYLVSDDKESSPMLQSVKIGDVVDERWNGFTDVEPPRVRLRGVYSEPSLKKDAPLEFEITDSTFIRDDSLKFTLDDEDATSIFSYERMPNGSLLCKGTPRENFSDGLHKATVEVSDALGNSVLATRYFLIGEPSETPRITLRDDGVTLIDGEPFFPIGIYGVTEREFNGNDIDEAFRGLKEAGFNFAHSYSIPREDRFLRAAEKYGFKLWSVARFPDERFVEVERRSPAVIAWYLGDDTSANTTPSELYDYFDSCKAVDPTRLTVQADLIDSSKKVSNYRPYVKGTDAFLPEIYPIRDDGEKSGDLCVAQIARDVKRSISDAIDARDGPKAIWPIIQYFQGWGRKRFPTYRELRAMSFCAIAAGANGITWYTYGGFVNPEKKMFNYGVTTTPERWKNISTIATQINELSPVILERTNDVFQPKSTILSGERRNPLGDDVLVFLLKRRGDKNYLFVVNTSPGEIEFQLEFPTEQNWDALKVLYDEEADARPEKSGRALRERLAGFDVRIYCW